MKSSDNIDKQAQLLEMSPVYVADQIHKVIKVMISRMAFDKREGSYKNISNRLQDFNTIELANKKSPGGAVIGVSLSLVKNILNGRDPYFINLVLSELTKKL